MVKSIWIEIRPALKCCHFCIVFKRCIDSEVKIKLKTSNLELELNRKSFNINFKEFSVEPLTMTAFKSTKKNLSFRVQAECDFQFRKHQPPKSACPELGKEKSSIFCQCHNPLTREIAFERILPLPSDDFSFTNMFCHLPASLGEPNTMPKLNDCFYSDNVIVINEENLTGCRKTGKFLKCKRCLGSVGTCDKNSSKFWVSCLKLPFNNSTLVDHFKRLISKAISNPVILFPKILLECEENETYLSLVVIDKHLVVSSCEENLALKNVEVVKVKYKFHSCCDSAVAQLKEDPFHSLHHVQVHKFLLEFSTKFLISCSKTIPDIFSKVDNETMAYISL